MNPMLARLLSVGRVQAPMMGPMGPMMGPMGPMMAVGACGPMVGQAPPAMLPGNGMLQYMPYGPFGPNQFPQQGQPDYVPNGCVPYCGPLSYGNLLNCGPSFNRDRLGCCPPELLPYAMSPFYQGPKCKDQILSGTVDVAAGDTETIVITPVVPFCVERVIVPSHIAPFFDINSFVIGNEPQTAGGGVTQSSVFSEGAADAVLKGDCVAPAVPITLSVTNTSTEDRTFYITFFGKSVD